MNRATEIARTVNPLRAMHAKWITGYGRPTGNMPSAEMKYWMELIGMVGGPVRVPCQEMNEEAKRQLRTDLEATGLPAKAAAGAAKRPG
jgi:dihydrodipicolinate synthase/N-acetylneuraminate lyase